VLVESSLITLERAINGVPGMSYITSDATSAGEATIQVVFELGTDPNDAMVNVKNRVDQVMSRLPQLVQLEGVVVNYVQRDAFAAAEGDPACGVAERLTRKGWPLAANPWRALRKCNVRIRARLARLDRTLMLRCIGGRTQMNSGYKAARGDRK